MSSFNAAPVINIGTEQVEALIQAITGLQTSQGIRPLPYPGEPGAPVFKGENVTRYLQEWEDLCDDARLTSQQKCSKFPRYCSIPAIRTYVEHLAGFEDKNWKTFKARLLEVYEAFDEKMETFEKLEKLCAAFRNAKDTRGLEQFLADYSRVPAKLVNKRILTDFMQVDKFIKALPNSLSEAVLEEFPGLHKAIQRQDGKPYP